MAENNTSGTRTPKNSTARKIMNGMEFLLELCKLLKSILNKVFVWVEEWETTIQNRTQSSTL